MSDIDCGYFIDRSLIAKKDLKHHQSSTTTVLAISFLTHLKSSNQRYQMVSNFPHLLDHFSLQQPGLVIDQVHPVQQSWHVGEPNVNGWDEDYRSVSEPHPILSSGFHWNTDPPKPIQPKKPSRPAVASSASGLRWVSCSSSNLQTPPWVNWQQKINVLDHYFSISEYLDTFLH